MDNFEFLMQFRIDTARAQKDVVETFEQWKKEFAKSITTRVELELDATKGVQMLSGLLNRISDLSEGVEKAKKSLGGLTEEAKAVLSAVNEQLPSIGKKLERAFSLGAEAVDDASIRITKRVTRMKENIQARPIKIDLQMEDLARVEADFRELKKLQNGLAQAAKMDLSGNSGAQKMVEAQVKKAEKLKEQIEKMLGASIESFGAERTFSIARSDGETAEFTEGGLTGALRQSRAFRRREETARALEGVGAITKAEFTGIRSTEDSRFINEARKEIERAASEVLDIIAALRKIKEADIPKELLRSAQKLGIDSSGKKVRDVDVLNLGGSGITGGVPVPPSAEPPFNSGYPAPPPVPDAGVGVAADPTKLVESIREALKAVTFLANIAADRPFLIQTVTETLASRAFAVKVEIDRAHLATALTAAFSQMSPEQFKVGVMAAGVMNGEQAVVQAAEKVREVSSDMVQAAEAARAITGAAQASEGGGEAVDPLLMRSLREQAKQWGKTAGGVEQFLSTIDSNLLPEGFAQNIETLVAARTIGGTREEQAARVTAASAVRDAIAQGFVDFQASDADDVSKARMDAFRLGFMPNFANPIASRERQVLNQGPSRNPKGVLAGVDYAAEGDFEPEWKRVVQEQLAASRGRASRIGDYVLPATKLDEQDRSINKFVGAMDRYTEAQNRFAMTSTQEERQRMLPGINRAYNALATAEARMADVMLRGRGDVMNADGQMVNKATAFFANRALLNAGLGRGLDGINRSRPEGAPVMRMDSLAAGLFSGDKEIAREFLRVQGATEEVLKDEQAIERLIEEQIGDLRKVWKIQEAITQELQEQVALKVRQRAFTGRDEKAMYRQGLRDYWMRTFGSDDPRYAKSRVSNVDLAMEQAYRKQAKEEQKDLNASRRLRRQREREAYALVRRGELPAINTNPGQLSAAELQVEALAAERRQRRATAAARLARYGASAERYAKTRVVDPLVAERMAYEPPPPPTPPRRRPAGGRMREPGYTGAFGNTIRNAFAMFGGVSLGYTAVNQIRKQFQLYSQFQQEIANIQGVLQSKSPFDALNVQAGVADVAAKYGVDLLETARAAKVLAQAGLEATEVVKELNVTMAAVRGMGMTIEQVQELQVSVRAVTMEWEKFGKEINYSTAVLDKISAVEARYAVGAQDLAQAIQILSPLIDNFSKGMTSLTDSFDYTIALTTVMVERLRITGTQAANILKFTFSRISRPEILGNLQKKFNLAIGDSESGDYLPLDRMIEELGKRYAELGLEKDGGIKQKQFAVELSGGRNIVGVTTVLEEYARVAKIAQQAAFSFGDTQDRARIGMDTLATSTQRMQTAFALFIKDALESTRVADGMRVSMNKLADAFNAFSANGGIGGTGGLLGTVLGGALAFNGLKSVFKGLSAAQATKSVGGFTNNISGWTRSLIASNKTVARGFIRTRTAFSGLIGKGMKFFGVLSSIFGPGGLLLAGIVGTVATIGLIARHFKKGEEAANRYRITLRDLSDTEFQNAPQYARFLNVASKLDVAGSDEQAKILNARDIAGDLIEGRGRAVLDTAAKEILGKEWSDILQMREDEFTEFVNNNREAFQRFGREVSLTFANSKLLPESMSEALRKMDTDTERSAAIIELLGGAAWSASYQIKAAMNDAFASIDRQVEDLRKSMTQLGDVRVENSTMAGGRWLGQFFTGGFEPGRRRAAQVRYNETRQRIFNRLTTNDEVPLAFREIFQIPAMRRALDSYLNNDLLSDVENNRRSVSLVDVLSGVIIEAAKDPALVEAIQRRMAYSSLPAADQMGFGQDILGAQLNVGPNPVAEANRILQTFAAGARVITEDAFKRNGYRAFQFGRAGAAITVPSGGTSNQITAAAEGTKRLRQSLVKFEDALFDLTATLYNSIRGIANDEEWARRTLTAFDKDAALIQLGRTAFNARSDLPANAMVELAKLAQQSASLNELIVDRQNEDGTPKTRTQEEREKIDARVAMLQRGLQNLDNVQLRDAAGRTREGSRLLAALDNVRKTTLGDTPETVRTLGELLNILVSMAEEAARNKFQFAQMKENLSLAREQAGKLGELEKARLPITALNVRNLQISQQVARDQYEIDKLLLQVRLDEKSISEEQYKEDLRRLELSYEFNKSMEARLALAQAERTLDQQVKQNLDGMLSGFRSTLTDLNIWEGIVDPQGSSPEERARARAEAIRNVIIRTLEPIGKTITDRLVNNAMDAVAESLFNSGLLRGVLELPEEKLRAEVLMADAMLTSGAAVATMWKEAIMTAGVAVVGVTNGGLGLFAGAGTGVTTELLGLDPLTGEPFEPASFNLQEYARDNPEGIAAGARRWAILSGLGAIGGTVGGTLIGKGGPGAQAGAALGTTLGTAGFSRLGEIAGFSALGGPLGLVAGGVLGGLLGGFLGGKTDKDNELAAPPVIQGLEAIERAQRETISTITAQTDALLKPENRLLDLPASFSVPGYAPSFGAAGGGAYTEGDTTVVLNFDGAPPANVDDLALVVERAVGDVLARQRRNRGW